MVATSDTPSEDERRAEGCLAKAAYCKWVVSVTTDQQMRDHYVKLLVAWEKEATELKKRLAK